MIAKPGVLNPEGFFKYARDRESVRLSRAAGNPPPWTDDPVLRDYRFCNVFREHDRTTIWIRENIREPLRSDPKVFIAMFLCRFINRIESLELITDLILEQKPGYLSEIYTRLKDRKPIVTAAYMTNSPAHMDKLSGILKIIEYVIAINEDFTKYKYLRTMHERIRMYHHIGFFLAYEIVTDLRHTDFLCDAPDINTWTIMGPGAARGMSRALGLDVLHLKCNSFSHQEYMLEIAAQLLEMSRDEKYWPQAWGKWEMREVEHTLCEYDKHTRGHSGIGRPKQYYDWRKGDNATPVHTLKRASKRTRVPKGTDPAPAGS